MTHIRIIILNFNQADYTLQCVESVLSQNYVDFDVIVVDNASREEEFVRLKENLDFRVKLIRNSKNLGFSAGNNIGAGHFEDLKTPDFYFFLNSDTILDDKETIRTLVQDMQNLVWCAASSPLVDTLSSRIDVRRQIQVRRIPDFPDVLIAYSPWLKRLPYFRSIYKHHIYSEIIPYKEKIYRVETINGAAFVVRSSVFEAIGGFDEGTFLYFEELIFGKQISNLRMSCVLNAKTHIKHFQGVSSGSTNRKTNWKMYKFEVQSELYYVLNYLKRSKLELAFLKVVRIIDEKVKRFLHEKY